MARPEVRQKPPPLAPGRRPSGGAGGAVRCPAPGLPAALEGGLGGVSLNLGRGAEGVEGQRGPTPKRS